MELWTLFDANPAADDDAILALCAPVYVPRAYRIDYTEMSAIWGADRCATFLVAIGMLAAAQDPATSALARLIDKLLSGSGINPADPQTATKSATIVAAGLATQDEARDLFNEKIYPTGQAETLETVAAARAAKASADAAALAAKTLSDARNARAVRLASIESYWRNAINTATTVDALPDIPEVPQP